VAPRKKKDKQDQGEYKKSIPFITHWLSPGKSVNPAHPYTSRSGGRSDKKNQKKAILSATQLKANFKGEKHRASRHFHHKKAKASKNS